ncbi:GNAT family N-acetyltransferase [Streptomyces capillispiralis]|uniref:GNAT family N-acetyltransferase n=1 Tax=Streptomyces capillispiralis TaxID=68182 RepID=UPI00142EFAB8|nr:GNAT family N-acetyltransferase [Streptomyces capillispiralis]
MLVLVSGELAVVRRAVPEDLTEVNAMHARCTTASLVQRYRAPRDGIRPAEWARLTAPSAGASWVTTPLEEPGRVIGLSHLMHTGGDGVRELGLLVEDDWQRRGLGMSLAQYAVLHGARTGCRSVTVLTAADNRAMETIARRLGASPRNRVRTDVEFSIAVAGRSGGPADAVRDERGGTGAVLGYRSGIRAEPVPGAAGAGSPT